MFFCNKQAKVCENCDFLLTFAHLRGFCFAKSLIFIKDLRNLREVELGVSDVDGCSYGSNSPIILSSASRFGVESRGAPRPYFRYNVAS